jgi:hypothetical protein
LATFFLLKRDRSTSSSNIVKLRGKAQVTIQR